MVAWAFRYFVLVVLVAAAFAFVNLDRPHRLLQRDPATSVPEERRRLAREIRIEADARGHFFLMATVDGVEIPFLLDTGASAVVLGPGDARRIGFRPAELDYSQRILTANGDVPGAPVTLREIRVGQLRVFDVPATVHGAPLPISLLGTSFLQRLEGYEVERDRLLLRW